nr:DUF1949 domain-containing protein [Nocardioides panacis]
MLSERYDVPVGHAEAGRLESDLRGRGVGVLGVDYAEHATLHLAVPAGQDLDALLAELTGGAVHAEPTGQEWVDQ